MRRLLLFLLLAIAILIPQLAVPVSAASYDLGSPTYFNFSPATPFDEDYPYFNAYTYNYSTGDVGVIDPLNFEMMLQYYDHIEYINRPTNIQNSPIWSLNYLSYGSGSSPYYPTDLDTDSPCLLFNYQGSSYENCGRLFFPNVLYSNLLLPNDGQYLKISIDFDTYRLGSIPSALNYLLSPSFLCMLGSGLSQTYPDGIFNTKVSPSTVTVSNVVGNIYRYTFYFQLTNILTDPLSSSSNVRLLIRFPYYVDNRASLVGAENIRFITNANIPLSYEILTVGGYDQALNDIENSIVSSNQQLIDLYTNQTDADKTHVLTFTNSNDDLSSGVDDYKGAASVVESLKNDFTRPPLDSMVNQQLQDFDTDDVKSLFNLPWVFSALGLVFSFTLIRLILYGTKEG